METLERSTPEAYLKMLERSLEERPARRERPAR